MVNDMCFASASELADLVRRGERSSAEIVDAYLARIDDRDGDVNAFVTVAEEHARTAAEKADRAVDRGDDLGPLHGVPIALKDLTGFREGIRHTFGCSAFADHVPDHTAAFVRRLEDAGVIVIGKTNTPEFGHRPKTVNGLIGPTATPFDLDHNAGGSSGGSAAAVAAGMAAVAQGGDAAGSVRIPAALCGVFGLKPTFGRVPNPSRPNAFQNATPFIDKGFLTRTVRDTAVLLDAVVGPHPDDPFSLPNDGSDFPAAVDRSVGELRAAYCPDLGVFPVEDDVESVVADAADELAAQGVQVERVEVDFGHSLTALRERARNPAMEVMSAQLARSLKSQHGVDFLGEDRDTVPAEFRRRIEAGRSLSAQAYKRVDLLRTDVFDEFQRLFADYDLLLSATTGTAGVSHDPDGPTEIAGRDVDPFADWVLTWPYNLSGHPAASVPAGFTSQGLPVGMQVAAPRFDEGSILAASAALERTRPWMDAYPGYS